jgi:hypothetical protein
MVCESWWAPDGIGSPWFLKRKVGRSAKLYKRAQMCNLSQNLLSMEDSKNPIASRWQEQPPLQTNFYLYFTNEKL